MQNFSACLKSKCHSILFSTLNLYLGDHLQYTLSVMVLFGSAESYNTLQFFFQPSSHSCYSVLRRSYKKPLAFIPECVRVIALLLYNNQPTCFRVNNSTSAAAVPPSVTAASRPDAPSMSSTCSAYHIHIFFNIK